MIPCGQDAGKDNGVDDTPRRIRASHFENNGEWRRAGLLVVKVWVVVWDIETDEEHGENATDEVS